MKKLLCLVVICLLAHTAYASIDLPAKCEVGLPSLFNKKMVKESELEALVSSGQWGQNNKLQKYWTVYSDRSNNITYDIPSEEGTVCDVLYFGEQVCIAKIENNFALVYSESQKGAMYPCISSSAKSKGWIPLKNLLLCNSCPTNEAGLYNKAFIVTNVVNGDGIRKGSKGEEFADFGKCYQNPIIKESAQELVADMNFYFVMKKANNGMVLLSRAHKMEGYTNSVLYGWVSTISFIPWNHCVCIEPNWEPPVAETLRGRKVNVYRNGKKTTDIALGRINSITQNPATKYRFEPQLMRYPLLGDNPIDNKQYSIIAFARPDGGGESLLSFRGTVDKCDSITGYYYWKPVILLSSDEFAQLMEKFQPVISATNTSNRKFFIDALKELVRLMIPGITLKEMDEINAKEVMALVEALPVKPNALKGRTLLEISDVNIVSNEEFYGIISDFQSKFRKLKIISENQYKFSFERNKTNWYWIPLEDLP